MTALLRPARPSGIALALLALAALAVAIGGVSHALLFHRGYAEVEVVGPLFLLNAIASGVLVLLLLLDRVLLFALGALAVSLGSLVSIYISHTASFFGFSEGTYDGIAQLIVAAEIAAVVLTLAGLAAARREVSA
jgi:hypothetical protein